MEESVLCLELDPVMGGLEPAGAGRNTAERVSGRPRGCCCCWAGLTQIKMGLATSLMEAED